MDVKLGSKLVDLSQITDRPIKVEPLDYSSLGKNESGQIKNEVATVTADFETVVKEEPDSSFVKPYIVSIRPQLDTYDYKCNKRKLQADHINKHPESVLQEEELVDIEEQLSTMTHLSMLAGQDSKVRSGEVYQCNDCCFRSFKKYMLRKHIKTHKNEKPHRCSKCNYRSVTLCSLQKHLISHMSEKPYKCPKCSYSGSRKLYLDVHMRTHVVNSSYKCSACEYTASQRSTLTKHFNVVHLLLPG